MVVEWWSKNTVTVLMLEGSSSNSSKFLESLVCGGRSGQHKGNKSSIRNCIVNKVKELD